MSVTSGIYLADWPTFQSALRSSSPADLVPAERKNGPLKEATRSKVATRLNLQTWWADVLEGVQKKLTDEAGRRLREVFRVLCWSSMATSDQTLDATVPKDSAELILSPETAARLASLADGLEINQFRSVVEPRIREVADGDKELTFKLFVTFARDWIDVLLKARRENKGVVVIVWV